jgi:hypothetical protein
MIVFTIGHRNQLPKSGPYFNIPEDFGSTNAGHFRNILRKSEKYLRIRRLQLL